MKNFLKFTTVVALMLSTVVGMAKEPKMNLVANSVAKSLIFTLEEATENSNVRISDMDNQILYSEILSGNDIKKKYDLGNLSSGTYYFMTESALKSYVYTISLDDNNLEIISKEETYKALFRKTEDKVMMNLLNLDKSKVDIMVYSNDDRLVYSDTIEGEIIVEKAFNFEDAFTGSYVIIVADGDKTYTEEFVVD